MLSSCLRLCFVILVVLVLATSAHAGYWTATYDLAPGSGFETVNPGGTYNDPITGTLTIEYDAATSGAALSGARLVAGQVNNTLNQPAGVLTVTGTGQNALSPGLGGTPGTLAGAALNLAVVANHTISGYLHCYDATGVGGFCSIFFGGVTASNTIPQTGSGTFQFPRFDFATTAGVGDFTSTTVVSMPLSGVTVSTVYVGREISRVWTAGPPAVPFMGPLAIGAVSAGLLASGGLFVARRKHAR